jgi:hypothetical protein
MEGQGTRNMLNSKDLFLMCRTGLVFALNEGADVREGA